MRRFLSLALLAVLLAACVPAGVECVRPGEVPGLDNAVVLERLAAGPCGSLTVRPPYFNVSGQVVGASGGAGWVMLYVLPNQTAEAARFVVEHCSALGRVPLDGRGAFVLQSLPPGGYVAVAPASGNASSLVLGEYPGGVLRRLRLVEDPDRFVAMFTLGNASDGGPS